MSNKFNSFHCPCCGQGTITNDCFDLYIRICLALGFAPVISSAYRCDSHNKEVGGVDFSQHTLGKALDLLVPSDMSVDDFADVCLSCGAGGLGRYYDSYFVHVDVGPRRDW